jgi:hypothetical protein
MNECTRGQCFRRCGPIGSRHGCHKAGVTIEGDFISVLSHKDPNTKTGGEGYNKKAQKNKQTNTKTAAANMEELAVWEPSQEGRENHAPPREGLSAMGSGGIGRNHRGLVMKGEEGAVGSSTRRLSP